MIERIKKGEEKWRIIGVYVREKIEETLGRIEQWMERGEIKTLVGGDFNARTGNKGGEVRGGEERDEEEKRENRKSKDEKVNGEGKKLIEFVEENGWSIFNGDMKGDEEGEYTFTGGKGCTVIDYAIEDSEVKDKINRMRIGDRMDSDHHPIKLWIGEQVGEGKERKKGRKLRREIWNEEGRQVFNKKIEGIEMMEKELKEEWERMEERLKKAVEETEEKVRKGEGGKTGWWDKECEEKKREVRKELRRWRKEGGEGREYRKGKLEYKEMCERKKREENDRWEKKAAEVKRERDVWEIVNIERDRRKKINERIEMEE